MCDERLIEERELWERDNKRDLWRDRGRYNHPLDHYAIIYHHKPHELKHQDIWCPISKGAERGKARVYDERLIEERELWERDNERDLWRDRVRLNNNECIDVHWLWCPRAVVGWWENWQESCGSPAIEKGQRGMVTVKFYFGIK